MGIMHEKEEKISTITITCTWDKNSNCSSCGLNSNLNCKWEKDKLTYFLLLTFYILVPGSVGFILVGLLLNNWLYLIVYVLFWVFFFEIFEIRVLCSHCPYYLGEKQGHVLHCLANQGSFKIWHYHPEPMKLWEKISFIIGAVFFALFPLVPELQLLIDAHDFYTILFYLLLFLVTLLAAGHFYYKLRKNICTRCVNFSCPFNSVKKENVDAYLLKNSMMKEAWEKSGYKTG